MSLGEHPQFSELTNGQQILARKIVKAELADVDEVVKAFAVRQNGKIGRWRQLLEKAGLRDPAGQSVNEGMSATGRLGVAASPWNMGHTRGC